MLVADLPKIQPVTLPKPAYSAIISASEALKNIAESFSSTPVSKEGDTFDVVFFAQEHRSERFKHLKRISNTEKVERRLRFGMEISMNRLYPPQFLGRDGFKQFCNITCRKFYGSMYFLNDEKFYDHLEYFVIAPGLIGANVKPSFWESKAYQNEMHYPDLEREEIDRATRSQVAADSQDQELNHRYLMFIAYRLGIPNVEKIPGQTLIDIVGEALLEPQNRNLPDIDSWKARYRKDVSLPTLTFGRDEEFDVAVGQMQSAFKHDIPRK